MKVLNREKNSHVVLHFPWSFLILTSFCVPLYQVIESEVFAGGYRVGSVEVAKRR